MRDPALRDRSEQDGVLTLTIDYRSGAEEGKPQVYATRAYRLKTGPKTGDWRLFAAGPAVD